MKSELPIPTSEKDIRRKNFRKSNLKQKQQQQQQIPGMQGWFII